MYWLKLMELLLWGTSCTLALAAAIGLARFYWSLRRSVLLVRSLPTPNPPAWLRWSSGFAAALLASTVALELTDSRTTLVQLTASFAAGCAGAVFMTLLYSSLILRLSKHLHSVELWDQRVESACASMRNCRDVGELQAACQKIWQKHLHVSSSALFLHSDRHYYACPPHTAEMSFSFHSLLATALRRGGRLRCLAVAEPGSGRPVRWSRGPSHRLSTEQLILSSLDARLVVPLLHGGFLHGFFVLGPAEPGYSPGPNQSLFAARVASFAASSILAETTGARAPASHAAVAGGMSWLPAETAQASRLHTSGVSLRIGPVDLAIQCFGADGEVPAQISVDQVLAESGEHYFLIIRCAQAQAVTPAECQATARVFRTHPEDVNCLVDAAPQSSNLVFLWGCLSPGSGRVRLWCRGLTPAAILRQRSDGMDLQCFVGGSTGIDPVELNAGDAIAHVDIEDTMQHLPDLEQLFARTVLRTVRQAIPWMPSERAEAPEGGPEGQTQPLNGFLTLVRVRR